MARRRNRADHGDIHADERWLVTYADMITLLLAVFIVMYALSDTNLRKFNAFAQSLSAAFTTDVFLGTDAFTVTTGQEVVPDVGQTDVGSGIVSTDTRTVTAVVKDYAIRQGLGADVAVDEVPEGIAIRIRAGLLYQPGRAALDDRSIGLLEEIAATLEPLPQKLRVVGHTDDTPTSGVLYVDNFDLSTARAMSVLRFLLAAGIGPERLSVAGAGQYDPIVPNTDEANRAQNRRVDILVLYPPASTSSGGDQSIAPSFDPVFGDAP
jgi:chemotaxis protein MotB